MEKSLVILACFVFVAQVKSECDLWSRANAECSSEEKPNGNSGRNPARTGSTNVKVGKPFSEKELKNAKTLKVTVPDKDPKENDKKMFEGDINGLDYNTIKRYAKDAAKIKKQFKTFSERDPKLQLDISSLHLDPKLWLNALKAKNSLWPKARIPYWVSRNYNSRERNVIAAAIADIHKFTCIRFVWRTWENDFVYIERYRGCWSYPGKQGGMQQLSLGPNCVHKGVILHEFMHAAGFLHEQSRTDRDNYVVLYPNNMQRGAKKNFKKYGADTITHLGTRYDYNSIMHYSKYAFSKNGRATILPRSNARIGQQKKMSRNDILKLNRLYQCNSRKQCNNKQSWCNYQWMDNNCFSGWVQRYCPKTCRIC